MISGVPCMAEYVVNYSEGACCCRGAVEDMPPLRLSVVVATCSPSARKADTGGLEFYAFSGYILRLFLKA